MKKFHKKVCIGGISAVCPVCLAGIGLGLGLSRYLGIDDRLIGIWLGALTLGLAWWSIDILNTYQVNFKGRDFLIILLFYFALFWPLYAKNIIAQNLNFLLKDKLIQGIILGSLSLYVGVLIEKFLRQLKKGRLFIFQKVIIPLTILILVTLLTYIIIK